MEKNNMEQIYSGYIQDVPDNRRFSTQDYFGSVPFDWEKGFHIEDKIKMTLPVNDQGESYSCVGQAISKYRAVHEILETGIYKEKSAKSVYSLRKNKPRLGMQVEDGKQIERNIGVAYRKDVPDGLTEEFMNGDVDLNVYRTKSEYYMIFQYWDNIDILAQHIRDYNGTISCYDGVNNGTNYNERPVFPKSRVEVQWSHCVYFGGAKLVNGEKRVYFLNSWGEKCGVKGWQYITENDIKRAENGYSPFYQGWVSVDAKNIMDTVSNSTKQFIELNEGKLVQGVHRDGEVAIIVGGELRTGTLQQVLATYLVRKEGKGVPNEIWDELKTKAKPI